MTAPAVIRMGARVQNDLGEAPIDTSALTADAFPGGVTEGTTGFGPGPVAGHGWWVLGNLSLLVGFASISTDLYLPAMGQAIGAGGCSPGVTGLAAASALVFALAGIGSFLCARLLIPGRTKATPSI